MDITNFSVHKEVPNIIYFVEESVLKRSGVTKRLSSSVKIEKIDKRRL